VISALLMGAVNVVLWAAVSLIAYANSRRARAAMPGGPRRVLLAQALLLAPVFLFVPAIDIGEEWLSLRLGPDSWLGEAALSAPLLVLWLLLLVVLPVTRSAVRNYLAVYNRSAVGSPSDQP
jgi:hypothetical protein